MRLRDKWIAALRSDKYKQGNGYLNRKGDFCCLGVLADITDQSWSEADSCGRREWIPGEGMSCGDGNSNLTAVPKIMLPVKVQTSLYYMNDGLGAWRDGGLSFTEIADYIEAHPEIDPVWPPEEKSK